MVLATRFTRLTSPRARARRLRVVLRDDLRADDFLADDFLDDLRADDLRVVPRRLAVVFDRRAAPALRLELDALRADLRRAELEDFRLPDDLRAAMVRISCFGGSPPSFSKNRAQ